MTLEDRASLYGMSPDEYQAELKGVAASLGIADFDDELPDTPDQELPWDPDLLDQAGRRTVRGFADSPTIPGPPRAAGPGRPRRMTTEAVVKARKMLADGLTQTKTAEKLGVSVRTLQRYL